MRLWYSCAMPTAIIADPIYRQHDPGWNHPESPERYDAVMRALQNEGLLDMALSLTPRKATEEELAWCHDPEYIAQVRHEIQSGMTQVSTGDTAISFRSYEVAQYAVGAVFRAVAAVMTGETRNAFCVVRPPGHHATPDRGMGFCIFNNIALGARFAQKEYGVKRVLIVDWDVHHGNGTQDIFYEDPSVFYYSSHQSPLYPFTGWPAEKGAGRGAGTTLNICLPAGAGREVVLGALEGELGKAMETFKPELVMISAGFDSRIDDPIGHLTLTDDDFRDMTKCMMQMAAKYAHGRLVSVLEGGYNLHGLASATCAHVRELIFGGR